MTYPLISIVITSYNRANWIGQAIESSLAQDYPNFEVVISDNCSTDNSDEIIRKYTSDPRVRYSRNENNIGMIPNFDKVFFELAKGKYITHLSNDDYFINPHFLSRAWEVFNRHKDLSVVFGMHNFIYESDPSKVHPSPMARQFEVEYQKGRDMFMVFADTPYFCMGGAVYCMESLQKSKFRFSGAATGDIEMNLSSMLHGNVGFINENVYMTRLHSRNASGSLGGAVEVQKMYLEVYDYMYKKAEPIVEKDLLNKWYKKLIKKNIVLCLVSVLPMKSRKETMKLNSILLKKYTGQYLGILATHPKIVARMILNM